jgi:glutamyl-Q tRNA(Asp) synthetase
LLRIDDLDTPRNVAGAADEILRTLEVFGLHWDESVFYQSQHLQDYHIFLEKLRQQRVIYRAIGLKVLEIMIKIRYSYYYFIVK